MNIPNLFDVNVTASSTISIGVVRHKMYFTSSLKISENTQKKQNEIIVIASTENNQNQNIFTQGNSQIYVFIYMWPKEQ